jgi:hypothetical protein
MSSSVNPINPVHIVVLFFDTVRDLPLYMIHHLCFIKSFIAMFIPTSIILHESMLDQMWPQHIICIIFLLIFIMFAKTTVISSNVVQHIILHKINKYILPFDIVIAKVRPIHPTLIQWHLHIK